VDEKDIALKVSHIEQIVFNKRGDRQMDEHAIHALRIGCRELLSLLDSESILYKNIKTVIKKTNKIRDIDVFLSYFMPIIKHKKIDRKELKAIQKWIDKKRHHLIKKLHHKIDTLEFSTQLIELADHHTQPIEMHKPTIDINALKLEKESLHRFRIAMKKMLYLYKNLHPDETKKIKRLKKIKDELGFINDNYNGMELLQKHLPKSSLLKKIDKIITKRNGKHLERIKRYYHEV